jgi:hypothetical protein
MAGPTGPIACLQRGRGTVQWISSVPPGVPTCRIENRVREIKISGRATKFAMLQLLLA